MKKQGVGVLALIAALGLTGCGKTVVLNEQQTAETAEYIAGLMLKHSKNYTESLQYPEETTEPEATGTPAVTTAPGVTAEPGNQNPSATSDGSNGSEEQEQEYALSDIMGISGIEVTADKITTCTQYTGGEAGYAIYAKKGEKIAVVNLKLKNTTSKDKKVNLAKKQLDYQLTTGDGKTYSAELSLAEDDLVFYNKKIKAGKTAKGRVVFIVSQDTKLAGCKMTVTGSGKSATVQIQ